MANVYIISDLHLGHTAISNKRGFESIEEYHAILIKKWNDKVNKNDKVFIVGDITMESYKHYPLLSQLRGNKTFILGNHDKEQNENGLIKYGKVAGMLKYKNYWITHCPMHPIELRGKINIHGHMHDNIINRWGMPDRRYINVSAERVNYTPVLFSEINKIK